MLKKASQVRNSSEDQFDFMLTDWRKKTNDHSVSLGKNITRSVRTAMGRKVHTCVSMLLLLAVFCASVRISTADTFRPVVRGRRGVVAGGQPLSVEAGMRILQRGGNAVDAGVATILAASVIEFSHFSFGGEVPILIKLKGKDVSVIEGMGTAPAKATREFFVNRAREKGSGTTATAPDSAATQRADDYKDMASMPGAKPGLIPSTGPLSATVPAVLDACIVALDRFGTKSLAEVMQPAGRRISHR